jgi:hypothetical protein
MIRNFLFGSEGGERVQITDVGRGGHYQRVVTIRSQGSSGRIPCELLVDSTDGVEIDLKCFKTKPPPPGFQPCPEAGNISLPKRMSPGIDVASFDLFPSEDGFLKTYNLNAADVASSVNLLIHINR